MDLVEGPTLDAYFSEGRVSVRETMGLFAKVAEAVNAAHLRGVIHRDLKPSNIRIDSRGDPHILDFGLARVSTAGDGGIQQASITMTGQFMGSLPWASPEQVRECETDIDVRTDVYSLGVILYLLLTGRMAVEVGSSVGETCRRIVEMEPRRPSVFRKEIDDEAEAIVLTCLAKDRELRYQSAGALAEDIKRYLTGRPILARAPSTVYQLTKLVRRNKLPSALLAALFLLVVGFGTWMSVLYGQAAGERDRAEREAKTSDAIKNFLINDMLAAMEPSVARGREITLEELLENAASRIENAFENQPLVEASIREVLGQTYAGLGLYAAAEPHVQCALRIRARELGEAHVDTLRSKTMLVHLQFVQGRYAAAEPLAHETLELSRAVLGAEHEVTLWAAYEKARLLFAVGQISESDALHQYVLECRRRVLGDDHPHSLASMSEWGKVALPGQGRTLAQEEFARQVFQTSRRVLGEEHPNTLMAKANLGAILREKRKLAEGESLLREALSAQKRVLGEEHPDILMTSIDLAQLLLESARNDEAEALYRKATAISKRLLGEAHPITCDCMLYLGKALWRQRRYGEAEGALRTTVELRRQSINADHPLAHFDRECLAHVLLQLGRNTEAEELLRESVEGLRRSNGGQYPNDAAWPMRCLVQALATQGKVTEAGRYSQPLLELRRIAAESSNTDAYVLNCYARELLTVVPEDLRDPEKALEIALRASEFSDDDYHYNRFTVGLAYELLGDPDEALTWLRRALARVPIELSEDRFDYEAALVRCLEKSGDFDAAENVYRDILGKRRETFPAGHADIAESLVRLGETLVRHGKIEEAVPNLEQAIEILSNAEGAADGLQTEAESALFLANENKKATRSTVE